MFVQCTVGIIEKVLTVLRGVFLPSFLTQDKQITGVHTDSPLKENSKYLHLPCCSLPPFFSSLIFFSHGR